MTLEQKLRLFRTLVAIGFKEIEVSFPAASSVEFDFTRRLIDTPEEIPDGVRLRAISPTREDFLQRTVDALQGAKQACVCTYISISESNLRYLGFTCEEAVEQAVKAVRYLRSITKDDAESSKTTEWSLSFGLESFSESDLNFAAKVVNAVHDAWEPSRERPIVIILASSLEVATPNIFADQVECLRAQISAPETVKLSVHTHNDRGCAVAAAELSLLAGAELIEGCLFGNGERAGNADLVTLALNLYSRGVHPQLDLTNLRELKGIFEEISGLKVHPRTPYIGEFSLQAFSGGHQNLIRKAMARRLEASQTGLVPQWDVPYLPLDPEDLGIPLNEIIRVNSQSGKAAAAWILSRHWGLELPVFLQVHFGSRVQSACEALKREMPHGEVLELFAANYMVQNTQPSRNRVKGLVVAEQGHVVRITASLDSGSGASCKIDGTGVDIASAVIAALPRLREIQTAALVQATQRICNGPGEGGFGAFATCSKGVQVSWGCAVHDELVSAQALAVLAAAINFIGLSLDEPGRTWKDPIIY